MTGTNTNCISPRTFADGRDRAPAVLVLEGALAPAGAAIVRDGAVAATTLLADGTSGRSDLFLAARAVLGRSSLPVGALDAVVCGTGPGSFTGLRIALGLARGLALGRPGLLSGGIDTPRLLAAAAGVPLPAWVAIPWGRLRVLVARAGADGVDRHAALVARTQLALYSPLVGATVVVPPALADVQLPAGTVAVPLAVTPIEALAQLVANGSIPLGTAELQPAYVVPPDAVLPARRAALPPGFSVVPLGPDDLTSVAAIERASFESPWSDSLLAGELEPGPTHVTIGAKGPVGELVAIGIARLEPDALSIYTVAVRPDRRHEGFGRALVRVLVERARAAQSPRVDLEVRVDNTAAIALYAGEGFVAVGRRPRYYHDGTDALLMSLTLSK